LLFCRFARGDPRQQTAERCANRRYISTRLWHAGFCRPLFVRAAEHATIPLELGSGRGIICVERLKRTVDMLDRDRDVTCCHWPSGVALRRRGFLRRRGIEMVGVEHLLSDRVGALEERPRAGEVALGLKQNRQIIGASRRIGMVRAEDLFSDRQGALTERLRAGEIALGLKQRREVEARRRTGMVGAEHLFEDLQGAAVEPPCADEVALGPKQNG